ncbi:MAG: hypothetical protein OEZ22_06320 [Spirochaetia bacterium]|nr:hypothetical protein [Spirochaetia bacterium]
MKRKFIISMVLIAVLLKNIYAVNENDDIKKLTKQYIEYNKTIELNQEQKKIKKNALTKIPAPCCSENTIETCCCPCNLAKSVWGLSKYLIAKKNYNEEQLKKAVLEWIKRVNPEGYEGTSCKTGKCDLPFKHDGCGGMKEKKLKF